MTAAPRVLSGRYRVDELIGRGGMATVYRGQDLTLGRSVAIKILKRDLAVDNAFRTRFRLEAQAASRMAHPAVVRVYDAGEDVETDESGATHPIPYIVMELIQGDLLKDLINDGPVPIADAIRYTDGILEALEYSHRAGVVHRDIKPGNVMVTAAGQVKVMDFGIARAVSDSSTTVADTTAIIGTAAYFSPEQAKGEPVDARADLYSTGVVLYELLTGRQPFRGESPVAVAYQHVSETPIPPSEVNESVPRSLDAVVLRALAKDPFQRFPDSAAFRETLDATVDGKAPTKRQLGALTSELYGPSPRQAAETARSLRQLSTDNTMTRTQAGPPVAWIWGGVALVAMIIIGLVFWLATAGQHTGNEVPSSARIVPDVTEMTYERAEELLRDSDLTARDATEPNSEVASGNVIRTDPTGGTSVRPGQQVTVYVSSGQEMATVPTLVGLDEAAARGAITGANLAVGTIRRQNDPGTTAGQVLTTDQAAGAVVAEGTTVNLVVASGNVVLKNLVGWTVASAEAEVTGDSTQLTVESVADPNCPGNASSPFVASQSIAPGDVPVNSTVTLTYCTGS